MSVYSGFTTRQHETNYYRLTESLLHLLQARILSYSRGDVMDEDYWKEQFRSIYLQMTKMEVNKYLPTKLSNCIKELAMFNNALSGMPRDISYDSVEFPSLTWDKAGKTSSPTRAIKRRQYHSTPRGYTGQTRSLFKEVLII